jgi:hypothetical protein
MIKNTKSKKAAFEMSMSTIIIIVLSVIFLILGLVLLKNIFGTATSSLATIDDKLKTQMASLFADEDQPIFIKPEDGVLKIRAGTTNFGFILGGKSKYGNDVKRGDIQFKLTLDKKGSGNCYSKIGEAKIKQWFVGSSIAASDTDNIYNSMDDYRDDMAFQRIQIDIPSGTVLCTQKVFYDVIDKSDTTQTLPIGGGSFTIEVLRKSLI